MTQENTFYATGKRKSAVARTWLVPGSGSITVNDRPLDDYFTVEASRTNLLEPFRLTNTSGQFDVKVRVRGGGINGQANAVRHGITKALILVNADFRAPLKKPVSSKEIPGSRNVRNTVSAAPEPAFSFPSGNALPDIIERQPGAIPIRRGAPGLVYPPATHRYRRRFPPFA